VKVKPFDDIYMGEDATHQLFCKKITKTVMLTNDDADKVNYKYGNAATNQLDPYNIEFNIINKKCNKCVIGGLCEDSSPVRNVMKTYKFRNISQSYPVKTNHLYAIKDNKDTIIGMLRRDGIK